jgi:Mn2+/Fe2+ NRAMP family transporter
VRTNNTVKSVVIWSIISAAFIGPGTVTTAVSAGSLFQLDLLWAVTFATLACIVLQEVAARITIASGLNLGQALKQRFGSHGGRYLQWFIGGSVIGGCAAYEAGNIVGAVAGIQLMSGLGVPLLAAVITLISALVLWKNNPAWISNLMTFLVVLMGVAFFALAATQRFTTHDVVQSAFIPSVPGGSELTILGLIGTTVVPYNIFLGSGISKGQTVSLMRIGLTISILIGGLITAAILVAGTVITDFSSFQNLHADLEAKVGAAGALALALGLFGAGFSSAITSPYAASIIVRTVFGERRESVARGVWLAVLLIGFVVGVSGLKPIPVILFVQALNGLILPFLVIFLLLVANDPDIMPAQFIPGWLYNLLLLGMLLGISMISMNNIDKSFMATLGLPAGMHISMVAVVSVSATLLTAAAIFRKRRKAQREKLHRG